MPGMTSEWTDGHRILSQASMRPRLNAGDDTAVAVDMTIQLSPLQ